MCRRRLAREHAGGKRYANRSADARFAVTQPPLRRRPARAHRPGPSFAAKRSSIPRTSSPSSARCYRAGVRGYLAHVRRPPRPRSPTSAGSTPLADVGVDLVANVRHRARAPRRLARAASAEARRPAHRRAAARPGEAAVRARPHRGVGARRADDRRRRPARAGARHATCPISTPSALEAAAWIAARVEVVQAQRRRRAARSGGRLQRMSASSPAATPRPDRVTATGGTVTRLLSDIMSLTPTNYDDVRAVRALVPQPRRCSASPRAIAAPSNDQACSCTTCCAESTQRGSCHDAAHVADVLDRSRRRQRQRCASSSRATPSGARPRPPTTRAHEHRRWRASTGSRRRCSWPPRASTRCGCTTACSTPATTRPAAAGTHECATFPPRRCRRSCSRARRNRHGLRLRLRYEYLQPEVDDDPEPWEPDDDDISRSSRKTLRSAVERMWAQRRLARRQRRRTSVRYVPVPVDLPRQRRSRRSLVAGARDRRLADGPRLAVDR